MQHLNRVVCGIILIAMFISSSAAARDFQSPEERPTRGTAYTGAPMQKRLIVGFYGTQFEEMLAVIGLTFSPFRFWEFGMNLAHLGAGIVNLTTKVNLLDKKYGGLGIAVGFIWAHGDWLWILPPFQRELAKGIDVYLVPVSLIGSVEATSWLHFDLSVGYNHAEVRGHMSGKRLFFDGELAGQQVYILPKVRFFIWKRMSLDVSGRLPMWGRVYHEATANVALTSGLRGGIRSAKFRTLDPLHTWLVTTAIGTEVIRLLYIGINISVGPYTEKIYSNVISAGVDLEWRF